MSAQVSITQLPAAGAITGTEAVPIVQNGVTVQTTTAAISASPSQTYQYLTVIQTPQLANSRYFGATNGLSITDGGAQGLFNVSTTGALLSLVNSGTGFQVKTSSTAITGRSIAVTGSGLSIADGNGIAGDPTVALAGQVLSLANLSANGLMTITTGGVLNATYIQGTANQIGVADGTGVSGYPTVSIVNNPVLPGTGSVTLPSGATASRPGVPSNGMLRYNTDTALLEAYLNSTWASLASGSGVTSISTGTGLTGGPITSTGTISIDVTGVSAATYGSSLVVPVIAVNAQGQITSATNTTINAVTLTTGTISTTPSGSTDIANKSYVDTVAQGLDTKASVVAGTTVNITLSGTQTVDGVVLVAADRVLVKNQTTQADNGLYLCAAGAWTRTTDMNTWAQVPGAYVFVETGTTLADTGWVCTSDAGGTIGVTAITWAQFSGAGSGVSSITFGSTGLTPATATTGAVTVAGTLALTNGGSGQTTAQTAMNAFAGAVTSGSYLRGNGANVVMNTIQVADVPTLNQNTSGTAAGLSATLAIASGGTGQTTAGAAFDALSPITTTGDLILGTGVNTASRLAIGSNGYLLTSNGSTATWAAAPAGGVTTFSAGTTGLTPSGATSGAVTLAGTLAVANGGTGATNATDARTNLVAAKSGTNSDITELYALNGTSYGVAYQNAGNQLIMGSALTFDGSMLFVPGGISGGTF